MDFERYYASKNEKPLDKLAINGGMMSIFHTICFVGDSLLSGEFEVEHEDKSHSWHDIYEYSWGNFIARMMGSCAYVFARGGMTAREYMESFAEKNDFWNQQKAAQCYVIALCSNDMTAVLNKTLDFGTVDDIKEDYRNNNKTFYGYYAAIIAKYKEISPHAKFFLVTRANSVADSNERSKIYDKHRKAILEIAEHFDNTYVVDIRKYAPECDKTMRKNFWMHGHMTPAGYKFTADIIASYIDYIIRKNYQDFNDVGFIGTKNENMIPLINKSKR